MKHIDRYGISNRNDGLSTLTATAFRSAAIGVGIAFATGCIGACTIVAFAAAAVGIGIAFAARCRRALVVAAFYARATIGVGIAFAIASPRDASTCKHRKYRQYEHHELSFHRNLLIEQKCFSEQEYPKR